MLEWILSSCVLILVVIGLRFCFRGRLSQRLQYALWGLVLLRLLIPVSFGSTGISVANLTSPEKTAPVVAHTVTPGEHSQGGFIGQVTPPKPTELPLGDVPRQEPVATEGAPELFPYILAGVWAAGCAAVAGMFLFTNLRFRRSLRASRRRLGEKGRLVVYVTDQVDTPCLFGLFRPAIYVTQAVAGDETLLRHTLEHEATHYSHGDHIWAVLRCLCLAIHWYDPLVWWAAFLSQRDGELACDEGTIRKLGEGERAEYGRTLIGMTCRKRQRVLTTATTMTGSRSTLRERILRIAGKPKMAAYTLVAVLLLAAVAVGCTFTGAKDTDGNAKEIQKSGLTGTKLFASESEIVNVEIHPAADISNLSWLGAISTEQPDLIWWVERMEYGEAYPPEVEICPPSEIYYVTVSYADGSKQSSYVDNVRVGGVTYRITLGPWHTLWENAQITIRQFHGIFTEDDPESLFHWGEILDEAGNVLVRRPLTEFMEASQSNMGMLIIKGWESFEGKLPIWETDALSRIEEIELENASLDIYGARYHIWNEPTGRWDFGTTSGWRINLSEFSAQSVTPSGKVIFAANDRESPFICIYDANSGESQFLFREDLAEKGIAAFELDAFDLFINGTAAQKTKEIEAIWQIHTDDKPYAAASWVLDGDWDWYSLRLIHKECPAVQYEINFAVCCQLLYIENLHAQKTVNVPVDQVK